MRNFINMVIGGTVGNVKPLAYTGAGKAVFNFSIAVNKSIRRGEEWEQTTTWFEISAWGATAERLAKYGDNLKGKEVTIIADTISSEAYLRKDGGAGSTLKVMASKVMVPSDVEASTANTPQKSEGTAVYDELDGEDIPF